MRRILDCRAVSGIARKRWAQRAQQLEFDELDAVRARAERWRNGLIGLTALLATVTIVKGPDTASALSDGARTEVVDQLTWAFVLLVFGSLAAMRAAFGWPAREMLLTGERLSKWEALEARRARWWLRLAAASMIVGVLLTGASTRRVLLDEKESEHLVLVDVGESKPLCGKLQRSAASELSLKVRDAFGDEVGRRIPHAQISRLRPVGTCPEP